MDEQSGIMYKLGAIETLLKTLNDKLNKSISDWQYIQEKHEDRISALEKQQIKIWTIGTTLASVAGFLMGIVGKWLS